MPLNPIASLQDYNLSVFLCILTFLDFFKVKKNMKICFKMHHLKKIHGEYALEPLTA